MRSDPKGERAGSYGSSIIQPALNYYQHLTLLANTLFIWGGHPQPSQEILLLLNLRGRCHRGTILSLFGRDHPLKTHWKKFRLYGSCHSIYLCTSVLVRRHRRAESRGRSCCTRPARTTPSRARAGVGKGKKTKLPFDFIIYGRVWAKQYPAKRSSHF
jgi:hypothetical protein